MFQSSFPFDPDRIHAAAVTCSDGRWGNQIDDFLENGLLLPRYDRVAIPGGGGVLAGHLVAWKEAAAFEHHLGLLVQVHELTKVILIAHQDCAFYTTRLRISGPVLEEQQRRDLAVASEHVKALHFGIATERYFARRDGGTRVTFERWDAGV